MDHRKLDMPGATGLLPAMKEDALSNCMHSEGWLYFYICMIYAVIRIDSVMRGVILS